MLNGTADGQEGAHAACHEYSVVKSVSKRAAQGAAAAYPRGGMISAMTQNPNANLD